MSKLILVPGTVGSRHQPSLNNPTAVAFVGFGHHAIRLYGTTPSTVQNTVSHDFATAVTNLDSDVKIEFWIPRRNVAII